MARRAPATSAAPADRGAAGATRAGRVEALLVGESLDTARLPYDFDVHHVALVGRGCTAPAAFDGLAGATDSSHLVIETQDGAVWGWIGRSEGFDEAELEAIATRALSTGSPARDSDLRLGIGEPAQGLAGWRLTHNQATAALSVATRGSGAAVRYADVALLATALKDELLATSLSRLYLEPLAAERDGGEELRRTLRAYFDADRSISLAGDATGVTRQAVARRLRAVEERLGRSIASCAPDLELALRLEALESAPTRLSAR